MLSEEKHAGHVTGQATCVAQTNDSDQERLRKLHRWAGERHIWINEDVVIGEMAKMDEGTSDVKGSSSAERSAETPIEDTASSMAKGEGFGVYVKQGAGLEERQVLVLVPKGTMLSPRTSSLSKHIPPDLLFSHDAAAGLLLTLVLTHEYLLGPLGPWWDYLQSMPRQRLVQGSNGSDNRRWGVPLPIAWTPISEEWKWIAGSEAGRIVQRTRDDPVGCIEGIGMSIARLRSFFTTTALPILQNVHRSFFDDATTSEEALWDDFVGMQSLISSRSFVVDMYHGLALVPLSDMFNHLDDANVHFEADDEVCDECGSLGQCPHNDDPLPSSAYGRPSAFLPAESGPNSADWKVPPALEGVDTVDMVAQEHIGSGQEAFNTYGLMSNSVLLTTYGFCLEEETQWERYGWEWRNAGERSEIRHALGLSTSRKRTRELEGDENGEGRYAVHANEGTATKSVLERWVMACVAFSGLPASAFAELKGDPMDVIAERKADTIPGTATLTLPVMSPFIALTRSATTEGSEAADDEETDLSEDLLETIAPLSTHDGSRDRQQPLFLDAEGRISLSLWRAALLATYAETHTAAIEAKPLRLAVLEAEEVLERTIIRAESIDTDTSVRNGSAHPAQDLVLSTLKRLYTLIESRRTPLRISGAKGEADALHLIETCQPGPLRSAVLQAFQEHSALQACLERIRSYMQVLVVKADE